MVRNIDRQFSSNAKDQSASLASSRVPWWTTPAQLNRMSIGTGLFGGPRYRRRVEHIQPQGADRTRFQAGELRRIDIRSDDLGAGGCEGRGRRHARSPGPPRLQTLSSLSTMTLQLPPYRTY